MRTMILAATAVVSLAAPATAQVYFDSGPRGFEVQVGRDFSYGERYSDRSWDSAYGRGYCRVIKSRMVLPDGHVTYRSRRVCD